MSLRWAFYQGYAILQTPKTSLSHLCCQNINLSTQSLYSRGRGNVNLSAGIAMTGRPAGFQSCKQWLFSLVINLLVILWLISLGSKISENCEKCESQFPKGPDDVVKWLIMSSQWSKVQRYSNYNYIKLTQKSPKLPALLLFKQGLNTFDVLSLQLKSAPNPIFTFLQHLICELS